MVEEINTTRKANESLGGVFEVRAFGLVPGIGSHISWEERLDGRLAGAIMSIQAMKGVGIGDGFDLAGRVGSQAHDEIFWSEEHGYFRETNRAGGVEGGMTNGDPVVVRAAMKPLPTLTKPLRSVDLATHEPAAALRERTDSCTVPAAGVVGEAMVALVLGAAYREKLGGDHIDDTKPALLAYGSASGGVARARRRDRPGRVHGRGQVDRRPLAGGGARRPGASTPIASWSSASASRSSRSSTARARRRSGCARRRSSASCSPARTLPVIALGGGAVQSERVRDALTRHTVVHLEIEPGDAWRRASGKGRPLARDPEPLRGALARPARALRVGVRRGRAAEPTATPCAARCRSCRALAEAPPGTRLVWAAAESGDYPVFVGRGLIAAGLLPAAARAAASSSPTRTSRGCSASRATSESW